MRRFLSFAVLALLSIILLTCGKSGTGPDPDTNEDEENTETITYTVSVDITPAEAGTVSPSVDSIYDEGEKIQLQANTHDEYVFSGWTGDLESTDNPYSLTVDQDYDLTANFELKSYALTVDTIGKGNVSESIVQQKSTDYDHGTVVELTATPAEGWGFIEWKGAATGKDNPVQITVDDPKEITAVFNLFYLAENGVTVKCTAANIGETGEVNGITYTKRLAEDITPENAETTCTSGITDMSRLFNYEASFNGDINSWDVSSVTDMGYMFRGASGFDQNLNNWDVSNVTNMRSMFNSAEAFNGDISSWNVSSVTDMGNMFRLAKSFNRDLNDWDVSKVTSMPYMFYIASSFDGDISNWDVGSVTDMAFMFAGAQVFNGNLNDWNVSNVTDTGYMFNDAQAFDGDLSNWDVSNVTDMEGMLYQTASFNWDLSSWCVSEIDTEPSNFAVGSALTEAHKPVWGTCPQ